MVYLNHPPNPSTVSPHPEACVPATAGTHAELLVWSTIDTSYQLINVKNAGHWQPQPVDMILIPSAISVLDCIRILVVAQTRHETLCYVMLPRCCHAWGTV